MHRHVRHARLLPCAAVIAAAITSPARASVLYVITDTGIPMPSLTAPPFRPARINSTGQVAGWTFTNGPAAPKFFLYSNGSVTYLPSPDPASTAVQFADINDHGDTIGTYNPAPGAPHGYVYSNGALTDLGTFLPRAINNAGVMVGSTPSGPAIYDHGTFTYLSSLGAARVTDISDNGHVVGNTTSSASGPTFVYYNGVLTNLGSLGIPRAVNDSGEVAGEDSSSGTPRSFVYSPLYGGTHKITPFGYVGPTGTQPPTWAYDITNNHLVVGAETPFDVEPVAHDIAPPATAPEIVIPTLLAPNSSRWSLDNAYSINPSGQILAVGTNYSLGVTTDHLVLATPTPFNTVSTFRLNSTAKTFSGSQGSPLDILDTSSGAVDFTSPAPFDASHRPLVLLDLNNADPASLSSYGLHAFTLLSDASTGPDLDLWRSLQSRYGPDWTCALLYNDYAGTSTFTLAWDFSLAPTTTVDRLLLLPEPTLTPLLLLALPALSRVRRVRFSGPTRA